jgi:hypothetical protein
MANDTINCPPPAPYWWSSLTPQPLVVDLPGLQGIITADFYAQVRDLTASPPTATATVIDVDDDFAVDVHLELTISSPLQYLICGYWCISVCLESMCGPNRYRFPRDNYSPPGYCCVLVDFQCKSTFDETICVKGDVIQEDECGSPYEGTVIVTLLSKCKKPKYVDDTSMDPNTFIPVGAAGALELPLLTFYSNAGGPGEE